MLNTVVRNEYSLSAFYDALEAWRKHESEYLLALDNARQPKPSHEALGGYMKVWIEGFLESEARHAEQRDNTQVSEG